MKADHTPIPVTIPSPRRWLDTISHSPEETMELAKELAGRLRAPCLILLEGELGSGKTTFTKGLVAGLGAAHIEEVTSPTFALIHEYGHDARVFHVDLYRVETAQELRTLGLDDLFAQEAFVIVEWGEKLTPRPAMPCVRVRFEHAGGDARKITADSNST